MTNWREKASHGLLDTRELDEHLVRIYVDRLAIWRKDGQRLTWEELQTVKQKIWGDRIAIEVYPASNDVVNLRHTRHLWHTTDIEDAVSLSCRHPEFGTS